LEEHKVMDHATLVIVGAGLAGAKAAGELRERGFDGRIVLASSESEVPYERPPLSKDYLQGKSKKADAQVHSEGFYADNQIDLLPGVSATGVDKAAATVRFSDGSVISFDKLLLATGSKPRKLEVPGAELAGVLYLRTFNDADAIREVAKAGARAVVVGSGWIGSEVAASLRQLDVEVTVIDPVALPNERIFGSEIGEFYRDVHVQHGVDMRLGQEVKALVGDDHVRAVKTGNGDEVEADFVVVGVGVQPRVELAREAGLEVDNGVLVSETLQTSDSNIFAAGDIANQQHPFFGQRVRVEHWSTALNQGPAAARAMLGDQTPYDRIPYFFSDQYDVGMEYSGYATTWDKVIFRGDRDSGEFVAFWIGDGRVLAGMNVNVWDVNEHVQALIRSRAQIDLDKLVDPDTPLQSLVPEQ
jgi:3-phenylpropionate/trans-cinnamate dioxygenase ferredoxin reductase component